MLRFFWDSILLLSKVAFSCISWATRSRSCSDLESRQGLNTEVSGFFNLLAHVQYFTVRKVSAANKQRYCWVISAGFSLFEHITGVQGWRSGESTHLPPMWPGFDSQIRRVGWVCWLSTLHRAVFSGYSGFPSPQKPTFDLICVNC